LRIAISSISIFPEISAKKLFGAHALSQSELRAAVLDLS
jgi:hypothetical protein